MEDLRDVIGDESKVAREQVRGQLGHLPAGQVRVPAVVECVVVPDGFRQRLEQVGRFHERADVAVCVAVEDDARFRRDRALVVAARERSLLHVALVHVLVVRGLEVGAGNFVERDEIVFHHKSRLVLAVLPAEQVGHAALAAGKENGVGRDFAKDKGLPGFLGSELDEVVIALDHRHEPEKVQKLPPPRELRLVGS